MYKGWDSDFKVQRDTLSQEVFVVARKDMTDIFISDTNKYLVPRKTFLSFVFARKENLQKFTRYSEGINLCV